MHASIPHVKCLKQVCRMAQQSRISGQPELIPCVRSLRDANRWAEHHLRVSLGLGQNAGLSTEDVRRSCSNLSMSSSFSGVGCVETAARLTYLCTDFFFGKRTQPRVYFIIEKLEQSQLELEMLPHQPLCRYTDMCDAIRPDVKDILMKKTRHV